MERHRGPATARLRFRLRLHPGCRILLLACVFWGGAEGQMESRPALNACFGVGQESRGGRVGPQRCTVTEQRGILNAHGVPYRRLEIQVSGTVQGYAVLSPPRLEVFTDAPELVFAQRGNLGPYYHGIGPYHGEKGSGLTLLVPESAQDWNGKLFVTVHGGTRPYQPLGELAPRIPGRFNPLTGANHYAGLMIDKGYAVVHTRRLVTSSRLPDAGEHGETVTLDDGRVLPGKSYGYHVGMIRDWILVAERLIESRLGHLPERTYYYGLSSGAALGRLFNYDPAGNLDPRGGRVLDGLLLNDAGGGWFGPIVPGVFEGLPILFGSRVGSGEEVIRLRPEEEDTWVFSPEHRDRFAVQMDIGHRGDPMGHFIAGNYLDAQNVRTYLSVKGENARLLGKKGLGPKTRTYEIRGVAHFDAGYLSGTGLEPENLDLGGVFDALIETLDAWADRGVTPPPSRSDLIGSRDARPSVQLPETACPTGVYYEFPNGTERVGVTGFAAYLPDPPADQAGLKDRPLEPLDRRGYPVDMNHNGIRDGRETLTEAWQRRRREGNRHGVLQPGQELTHDRYVGCVVRVARELTTDGLLSLSAAEHYLQEAEGSPVGREGRAASGE